MGSKEVAFLMLSCSKSWTFLSSTQVAVSDAWLQQKLDSFLSPPFNLFFLMLGSTTQFAFLMLGCSNSWTLFVCYTREHFLNA
jgi:hypothetical protein